MSNQDELATLKARAKQLGITYSPNIGLEKLREKVNSAISPVIPKEEIEYYEAGRDGMPSKVETKSQKITRQRKLAAKLVRVRVNCMNPNKKDWEGEIYTVSNSVVGSFRKYVPFNNEEGWHIPQMMLNHLQERECQVFYTAKGPRGNKIRKGKIIKELAIEVLPPLTRAELEDLAKRQAMANNLD